MFNFFSKNKISSQEMASSLFLALIEDPIKNPLNDIDGNIILNTHEQSILLLSHLCKLLDGHDLKMEHSKEWSPIWRSIKSKINSGVYEGMRLIT